MTYGLSSGIVTVTSIETPLVPAISGLGKEIPSSSSTGLSKSSPSAFGVGIPSPSSSMAVPK